MSRLLVYVAGPYSNGGEETGMRVLEQRVQDTIDVAGQIWEAGGDPIVPLLSHYLQARWGRWMDRAVAHNVRWYAYDHRSLMMSDAALFLPGWDRSRGCRIESQWAEEARIPCFYITHFARDDNGRFLAVLPDPLREMIERRVELLAFEQGWAVGGDEACGQIV